MYRKFVFCDLKGVLNGFLIQVRDIKTAPNSLRKDTKCISALILKKISRLRPKILWLYNYYYELIYYKLPFPG